MRFQALTLSVVLALSPVWPIAAADIYLVRHAEKVTDGSPDPDLTDTGRQRAENLATILESAGVKRIFSTDYHRTRSTAAPLAELLALPIELYDPDDLEGLATRLLGVDDSALVVGHSDTTPELVDLLGGEGGPPIDEVTEYDRLYLVEIRDGATQRTILLHTPP